MYIACRYEAAIEQTLLLGGDTAIAGGLLGAYWGAGNIPESISEPVLSCSYKSSDSIGQDESAAAAQPGAAHTQGSRLLSTAQDLLDMAQQFQTKH